MSNNIHLKDKQAESVTLLQNRIPFHFDEHQFKRTIAGTEVILHCHHYNARIQGTIESSVQIDGREIIRSSAETVFTECISRLFEAGDTSAFKWRLVEYLYAYLGYGIIDCAHATEGYFCSDSSHFVEGWTTGFEKQTQNVCTFTEGFLQGAYFAITGIAVDVREVHCMVHNTHCRFEITLSQKAPIPFHIKKETNLAVPAFGLNALMPVNIDVPRIISAMRDMPFQGNKKGLIPLFNVYMANIPADFYNLISIRFLEEMKKHQMGEAAKKLLISCGEICALHTFRGVMNSTEWDALVQPMITETKDSLFALITITQGLGWGRLQVKELLENEFLELDSMNGYEALGYGALRPLSAEPKCLMLTGVSAGLMELLYSDGAPDNKFGTFVSHERQCICTGAGSCRFEASRVTPEYE